MYCHPATAKEKNQQFKKGHPLPQVASDRLSGRVAGQRDRSLQAVRVTKAARETEAILAVIQRAAPDSSNTHTANL